MKELLAQRSKQQVKSKIQQVECNSQWARNNEKQEESNNNEQKAQVT